MMPPAMPLERRQNAGLKRAIADHAKKFEGLPMTDAELEASADNLAALFELLVEEERRQGGGDGAKD